MAAVSRFCVFWIRNTIRNVTMVVNVLMVSCQASLKPKSGPLIAHSTTMAPASAQVTGRPENCAVFLAKRVNQDVLCIRKPPRSSMQAF